MKERMRTSFSRSDGLGDPLISRLVLTLEATDVSHV